MKLTMDQTQRLNLHALLGAQRADVGSIRAIWAVQDKLALDAGQEKLIELKREMVNGTERTVWNPTFKLAAKEFEFSEADAARIQLTSGREHTGVGLEDTPGLLSKRWDSYAAGTDRR
jgi:hypothetical protein